MNNPSALPCPFCGFDDPQIEEVELAETYSVTCPECEAMGPFSRVSPQGAVLQWNVRQPGGVK